MGTGDLPRYLQQLFEHIGTWAAAWRLGALILGCQGAGAQELLASLMKESITEEGTRNSNMRKYKNCCSSCDKLTAAVRGHREGRAAVQNSGASLLQLWWNGWCAPPPAGQMMTTFELCLTGPTSTNS
jgi:hypothetical protein